jgi:hypothetical protein
MAENVPTIDVRQRIGEMLNRVVLRRDEFVIERRRSTASTLSLCRRIRGGRSRFDRLLLFAELRRSSSCRVAFSKARAAQTESSSPSAGPSLQMSRCTMSASQPTTIASEATSLAQ